MKKFIRTNYFAIIMAFIYIPIVVMIIFSFNAGTTVSTWRGGSLRWYENLFQNSPFIKSIITSLFVALISTTISLLIGVAAAIGLQRCRRKTQRKWMGIANIPLINADVVTAVSLMMVFLIANLKFGLFTLIMAHVSFNVPYVLITVMPRLSRVDRSLVEAGEDLGSNNWQLLTRVILPVLKPAIIAAAAIAFAMSFDDFIISYFTGGSQSNFSTFIYSAKKIRPYVFAFGTILVAIIIVAILTWNAIVIYRQGKISKAEKLKNHTYKSRKMAQYKKDLGMLEAQEDGDYKLVYSKNPLLWIQYWWLGLRIKIVSTKNYDKKITRLEWKRYKLRSQINKEKRYYNRQEVATKRLEKLKNQLNKTHDVQKAARLTLQIEKVENRLEFLNEEIESLENREEAMQRKASKLSQEILLLKWTSNSKRMTKKDKVIYARKIKCLEAEKIEVLEGKNNYKLRMVVERLRELQDKNYNAIFALTDKKKNLEKEIFLTKPLTHTWKHRLEQKIAYKKQEIKHLKNKINRETLKVTPDYDSANNKVRAKGWFARSWKMMGTLLLAIAAFTGLTVAYVLNNTYDLVIANWGEYIDPTLISDFEKQYDVRVNYQEFDSNETLYNKLYTFSYDVMVPSDYMVKKLAQENRLELLDYNLLNANINAYTKKMEAEVNEQQVEFNPHLVDLLKNYPIGQNDEYNLLSYSVPYLWGDLVIVVNPTAENVEFLKTNLTNFTDSDYDLTTGWINQEKLNWDILRIAARANKRVALNNDPKNVFSIAGQVLFQKPNLESIEEINDAYNYLKDDFIDRSKVSLNNDELVDNVGRGSFDFAMMYNGDAMSANRIYNGEDAEEDFFAGSTKFLFGRPNIQDSNSRYQTTNVFSDNMVISSNTRNKDLSYKFINFIFDHSTNISEYVGVTSPITTAMEELTQSGAVFADYKRLYYPCVDPLDGAVYQTNNEILAFKYLPGLDEKLVNLYNELIAGKIG